MAWNNNNTPQVQALKDYQAIPDETIEALDDFQKFVDEDLDWANIDTPPDVDTEDLAGMIAQIISQYLMQDDKSQARIKAGEQELLKRWTNDTLSQ